MLTAIGAPVCSISANARPHQLHWGDQECGYYTSHTCSTGGWSLTAVDGAGWSAHVTAQRIRIVATCSLRVHVHLYMSRTPMWLNYHDEGEMGDGRMDGTEAVGTLIWQWRRRQY